MKATTPYLHCEVQRSTFWVAPQLVGSQIPGRIRERRDRMAEPRVSLPNTTAQLFLIENEERADAVYTMGLRLRDMCRSWNCWAHFPNTDLQVRIALPSHCLPE